MNKDEIENHIIKIDGETYRMTHDPWTDDWAVEEFGEIGDIEDSKMVQPTYLTSKDGAIEYILENAGLKKYGGYKIAPDRTSA